MKYPRYLCIDPEWQSVPENLLTKTIYSGVRFVVRPDLWGAVTRFLDLGLDIQLVFAKESGPIEQYRDWFTSAWMWSRISWVIGNEPDGTGESSWIMSHAQYRQLWESSRILSGPRWIAGLCSGDVEYAKGYLQKDAAGVVIHIYTLDPARAAAKVTEYRKLRRKLWVGETHPNDGYALDDYTWTAPVNDFCYSNAMVDRMGLYA